MKLNVYRNDVLVGVLDILTSEPFYGFKYTEDYSLTPGALPLSLSLPIIESRFSWDKTQPFFEGLLPEGDARNVISRRLGIPLNSSVKLLQALGRDSAGAISIISEDECLQPITLSNDEPFEDLYAPLDGGLEKIACSPRTEIPRLQEDMRLSLAGAQEKIALFHKQNTDIEKGWYIPLKGMPSSHIIKPGLLESHYPDITLNEFICLRTAAACGIQTANVELLYPETPILVIQRFDRLAEANSDAGFDKVTRIHQEDFCQACGIISGKKYEHDGGPGFKDIREMLAKYSINPVEDLRRFVKMSVYNYLIGNCDAHSKNFSIFHNTDKTITLTPAYDLISTTIYDGHFGSKLSRNMGMRIGLHENIDKVNNDDFILFSKEVRMHVSLVRNYRDELISCLPDALNKAAEAALNRGFTNAYEISDRILNGCKQRAVNI
ncbi:MAG: type II toxin-antitoxin system HipA family toxin [Oscillospiraceae bacterium]|nr:type II toxin-antitoxin system HipA family toxin [Oscillospiraceae bacterium]